MHPIGDLFSEDEARRNFVYLCISFVRVGCIGHDYPWQLFFYFNKVSPLHRLAMICACPSFFACTVLAPAGADHPVLVFGTLEL